MALTEEGERKTEIMRDISAGVFADAFDGVSEAELEALQRALPIIIENLGGTLPDKVE